MSTGCGKSAASSVRKLDSVAHSRGGVVGDRERRRRGSPERRLCRWTSFSSKSLDNGLFGIHLAVTEPRAPGSVGIAGVRKAPTVEWLDRRDIPGGIRIENGRRCARITFKAQVLRCRLLED